MRLLWLGLVALPLCICTGSRARNNSHHGIGHLAMPCWGECEDTTNRLSFAWYTSSFTPEHAGLVIQHDVDSQQTDEFMEKRMSPLNSILLSLVAGLSTALGACYVFANPGNRVSPNQMAFTLALAGGVMLSVTVIEFWWPVIAAGNPVAPVFLYSFIGAAIFLTISYMVPEPHLVDDGDLESNEASTPVAEERQAVSSKATEGSKVDMATAQQKHKRLACVLFWALTAHNFPEGMAVAMSALHSDRTGIIVMIAISLHNIPEGIAIAVAELGATGSKWRALGLSLLSGMAEPLGAIISLIVLYSMEVKLGEETLENLLCVVGGVMATVALKELLPEAWRQQRHSYAVGGFFVGALLMASTIPYAG